MRVSDKTATKLVAGFILIMSILALGIIREVYIMSVNKHCAGWESKPLDQVSRLCIKGGVE